MQKRHFMLFRFMFTSYVIQFIYVIIMETCNLISIINCAVKIIYQVFVRLNTTLSHSSKLYLFSFWNNSWSVKLSNVIAFWRHLQQNHWAWHCCRKWYVCRLISLHLTWTHMSQRSHWTALWDLATTLLHTLQGYLVTMKN